MKLPKIKLKKVVSGAITLGVMSGATVMAAMPTLAANLTSASVLLSGSRPSNTATYTLQFKAGTAGAVRCIIQTFTTTATGSTAPTGMSASSGTLGTLTALTGTWALAGGQAANVIKVSASDGDTLDTTTTYAIPVNTVTNSSAEGTYFDKVQTYSDEACTTAVDSATLILRIQTGVTVSATVDPTLTFNLTGIAAAGTYKASETPSTVDTGCTDSATAVSFPSSMVADTNYSCAQSMSIATNASNGYQVTLRGTHTSGNFMKSSVGEITNQTGSNGSPAAWPATTGQTAFGYTSDDAALSNTGDGVGRFNAADKWAPIPISTSPAEVAYNSAATNGDTVNVGYRMRFAATTKAGTYSGTVVYVVTPVF
jgi:hypothetical protein